MTNSMQATPEDCFKSLMSKVKLFIFLISITPGVCFKSLMSKVKPQNGIDVNSVDMFQISNE